MAVKVTRPTPWERLSVKVAQRRCGSGFSRDGAAQTAAGSQVTAPAVLNMLHTLCMRTRSLMLTAMRSLGLAAPPLGVTGSDPVS